jgi:hypothetical protein
MVVRCGSFLIGILIVLSPARAQSIDCLNPTDTFDRLVCETPKTRVAYQVMQAALDVVRAQLSEEGQRVVSEGQRQWLAMTRGVTCSPDPSLALRRQHKPPPATCAEEQFKHRADGLVERNGAHGQYKFVSRETYRYWPAPLDDGNGLLPGFFYEAVATTYIDQPATPGARAFNDLIERERVRCPDEPREDAICGPERDSWVFSLVLRADADIIQFRSGFWGYRHGNPRGRGSEFLRHFIVPLQRELTENDIFDATKPWKSVLAERYLALVRPGRDANGRPLTDLDARSVIEDYRIVLPESWLLDPTGLTIVPSTYLGDPARYVIPNTTIPWSSLRGILRDPLPFRLPQ